MHHFQLSFKLFLQLVLQPPVEEPLPVGVGESHEGKLLGAVDDEVFCHLTEVRHTQGGPEQELRCEEAEARAVSGKERTQSTLHKSGSPHTHSENRHFITQHFPLKGNGIDFKKGLELKGIAPTP